MGFVFLFKSSPFFHLLLHSLFETHYWLLISSSWPSMSPPHPIMSFAGYYKGMNEFEFWNKERREMF